MDIQFIIDQYAAVAYIVKYVSKIDAGLCKLLREAATDLKENNISLKEKFRNIAKVCLNSSLMSAQEAVYHILSLKMVKSSRATIFINTSRMKDRVKMLKSEKDLCKINPDSNDIFLENLFEKYSKKPQKIGKYLFG